MQIAKTKFFQGVLDGVPIGLGYLSVSIAFGILAVSKGLSVMTSTLISLTNVTSAGQVAGVLVIAASGSLLEMALTQLIINVRYALMAISLSQKLDKSFTLPHRLILSTFITDEIFGVASGCKGEISIKYMYGLALAPYIGWAVGTFLGASLNSVLPDCISSALGIMLYGMFVAIVLPAAKKSKGVLVASVIAIGISCLIKYIPIFGGISSGFSIIIASVIGAGIAGLLLPVSDEEVQNG